MKSWIVHYKNKYPGGLVLASEQSINVYCNRGVHRVSMQRDGHGNMVCVSEELGLRDGHSLDPIPKNSRVWKLYASGKIALSEEGKDRLVDARSMMVEGRIPSIAEFKALGAGVDQQGNLLGMKTVQKIRAFDDVMKDAQANEPKDVIDITSPAAALDNEAPPPPVKTDAAAGIPKI